MSPAEVVVQGTLRADGTLELDQKPGLPPGRVTVVVRAAPEPAQPQEGWWPYMQRMRAELEAAGHHFMNEAEMEAHLAWLRDDEDRIDRLHREIEQQKRKGEQP
jgi:hypothetical protein